MWQLCKLGLQGTHVRMPLTPCVSDNSEPVPFMITTGCGNKWQLGSSGVENCGHQAPADLSHVHVSLVGLSTLIL